MRTLKRRLRTSKKTFTYFKKDVCVLFEIGKILNELTVDLLNSLAENKVRSIKIIPEEESLATGYMDYLHKQKKDNKF